jgi:hypothetical protein
MGEADTTPDPFVFIDVDGATPGQVVASNIITITGIDAPTPAAISMSGGVGEYRKNGGAWTTSLGSVVNGDTVQVRVTASATPGVPVAATLTIGGYADTFTVTSVIGGRLDLSSAGQSGFTYWMGIA